MSIARQHGAQHEEAGALRGLGEVYQSMGDHSTALKYHTQHLGLAQSMGDREGQIQVEILKFEKKECLIERKTIFVYNFSFYGYTKLKLIANFFPFTIVYMIS